MPQDCRSAAAPLTAAAAGRLLEPACALCCTFEAMGLSEPLLRALHAHGYEKPTPTQQRAIVPLLSGKDTAVETQSGSGKTAAFVVGVLHQIDLLAGAGAQKRAFEIRHKFVRLGGNAACHACVGGTSVPRRSGGM